MRLCRACVSIGSILCEECFEKKNKIDRTLPKKCQHCDKSDDLVDKCFVCPESDCKARMRFCRACISIGSMAKAAKCKSCWHAADDICIHCGLQKAQHALKFLRSCKSCAASFFCEGCDAPAAADVHTQRCRMCSNLALWCEQHCSATEIQSRLCRKHFDSSFATCNSCCCSWHLLVLRLRFFGVPLAESGSKTVVF